MLPHDLHAAAQRSASSWLLPSLAWRRSRPAWHLGMGAGAWRRQNAAALPNAGRARGMLAISMPCCHGRRQESAKAISEAIERICSIRQRHHRLLMERSQGLADKNYDWRSSCSIPRSNWRPTTRKLGNRRAYCHFMRDDVERALDDLRRTLALEPSHFKALRIGANPAGDPARRRPRWRPSKQLLEVHPFWSGAKQALEELEREVEGQGI